MRMDSAKSDSRRAGFESVWLAAWLAVHRDSAARAQSQRKTPAKSPATSSAQRKEDPLAPLLQQANDAIDKMDFAAALDPLQKYIAQRPDEPYPHFQLGYAYVGLKRSDGCEGRILARDCARSEDGGGAT